MLLVSAHVCVCVCAGSWLKRCKYLVITRSTLPFLVHVHRHVQTVMGELNNALHRDGVRPGNLTVHVCGGVVLGNQTCLHLCFLCTGDGPGVGGLVGGELWEVGTGSCADTPALPASLPVNQHWLPAPPPLSPRVFCFPPSYQPPVTLASLAL
jgi:hypothetical protein